MHPGGEAQSEVASPESEVRPSAFRAFAVLVVQSFQRHWRVRQMGWVALGLLAVLTVAVAVMTHGPRGWGLPNRYTWRYQSTYRDFPKQLEEAIERPLSVSVQHGRLSLVRFGIAWTWFLSSRVAQHNLESWSMASGEMFKPSSVSPLRVGT